MRLTALTEAGGRTHGVAAAEIGLLGRPTYDDADTVGASTHRSNRGPQHHIGRHPGQHGHRELTASAVATAATKTPLAAQSSARSASTAQTSGIAGTAAASTSGGSWSPMVNFPIVPAAAALLPNNRVLLWSSAFAMDFNGGRGQTQTAILDLTTNTVSSKLVSNTNHDMFCPGVAILPEGKVMVTGGNDSKSTSVYDPGTDSWSAGPQLAVARGYHSMTTLPNGQVFTIGGSWSGSVGGRPGEVWMPSSGWHVLSDVPADPIYTNDPQGVFRADNHAWLFPVSDGRLLQAGPSKTMHWITTSGNGSINSAGLRGDSDDAMNGNAVMYDTDRLLTLGGSSAYQYAAATNRAYVVDVRGSTPRVTRTADLANPRGFANSVVLPDGGVLTLGGQGYDVPFSDDTSVLAPELWSPDTGQWRTLAAAATPRNYHSWALLLPDGRVISGGGGLCGGCATNHANAEIFTPPYLLNGDGSARTRPAITQSPRTLTPGSTVTVTTDRPVTSFAMLRDGEATHSINNDQRRISLPIQSAQANTYTLKIPADGGVALPGPYMLYALDAAGTPSVSAAASVPVAAPGPDAPTLVTTEPGDLQTTVRWVAPASRLADHRHTVRYRPVGSPDWVVAAHPASTSTSLTVSGLTDGTAYEFSVAAVSQTTGAFSPAVTDVPAAALFADDFESLPAGPVDGKNGWQTVGPTSAWTVGPGGANGSTKVLAASGAANFFDNQVAHAAAGTVSRLTFDASYLGSGDGSVYAMGFLRRSGANATGVDVFANASTVNGQAYDGATLYGTGSAQTSLAANTWYTYDLTTYNDADGVPKIAYAIYPQGATRAQAITSGTFSDPARLLRSVSSFFGLAANNGGRVAYDNVRAFGTPSGGSSVAITSPQRSVPAAGNAATLTVSDEGAQTITVPYIQTSSTLSISGVASSTDLLSGGRRLRFTLSRNGATVATQYATTSPATVSFTGLAKGTYDLALTAVDANNAVVPGLRADAATGIGVGDIVAALGDSITMGYNGLQCAAASSATWVAARSAGCTTSADGRNFAQYGPPSGAGQPFFNGWLVDLNNRLSTLRGYPVFVMNEGWGGITSAGYLDYMSGTGGYATSPIGATHWADREKALAPDQFLINLGVNDTALGIGAATTRSQLTAVVNLLKTSYGGTNANIQVDIPNYMVGYTTQAPYLDAVRQVIADTGVQTGADFYTYFAGNYQTQYVDQVHPNPTGMAQMARLHLLRDIAPANVTATSATVSGSISVSWASLASTEASVTGYLMRYGTSPGVYPSSVAVGNTTTATLTGLSPGVRYYLSVVGTSPVNPTSSTAVSESAASAEVSAVAGGSANPSTTVDDATVGTTPLTFAYVGGWAHCKGGCNTAFNATFNADSVSYSGSVGDTISLTFTSTRISFTGLVNTGGGTAGVRIDGGAETAATWYAPTGNTVATVYTSPVLRSGTHTLRIRVSGNGAGGGPWVNLDKAVVSP